MYNQRPNFSFGAYPQLYSWEISSHCDSEVVNCKYRGFTRLPARRRKIICFSWNKANNRLTVVTYLVVNLINKVHSGAIILFWIKVFRLVKTHHLTSICTFNWILCLHYLDKFTLDDLWKWDLNYAPMSSEDKRIFWIDISYKTQFLNSNRALFHC